jgi:hypothetical protein
MRRHINHMMWTPESHCIPTCVHTPPLGSVGWTRATLPTSIWHYKPPAGRGVEDNVLVKGNCLLPVLIALGCKGAPSSAAIPLLFVCAVGRGTDGYSNV